MRGSLSPNPRGVPSPIGAVLGKAEATSLNPSSALLAVCPLSGGVFLLGRVVAGMDVVCVDKAQMPLTTLTKPLPGLISNPHLGEGQ